MKEKINLDEKIVLFNQTMTREEAIIELANHYLPFFQSNNIHHGNIYRHFIFILLKVVLNIYPHTNVPLI